MTRVHLGKKQSGKLYSMLQSKKLQSGDGRSTIMRMSNTHAVKQAPKE